MMESTRESAFSNTECRVGFQAGTIINHGQITTVDNQYSSEKLKSRKHSVLQRLYKTSYQEHKDRNPDRVPGTCEWFVTHPRFQEWQESKSKSLWVSADPGCGKSVLAKYLIDSVLTNNKSRTTCYFFFKDDIEDQKSVTNAICCILHQLFSVRRELLSEKILEQFEIRGDNFINSFTALWGTLLSVARASNPSIPSNESESKHNEIVCLLDAIDECEGSGRIQLVKELSKLDGPRGLAPNLKFLLISRPYSEIRHGLIGSRQPRVIHLSGESEEESEKISREIDIYIKARVEDISTQHQLESEDEELLLKNLMSIPNRTYLWVYLTLDLIETDIYTDNIGISEAITRVSRTVNEAYERILNKSHNFEKAKKLLQIVVAAVRPLSLTEMCMALALKNDHQSCSDLRIEPEARFRDHIRDLCGFLIVIKDSRIYLLHQTVKEFLVQNHGVPAQSVQASLASSSPAYKDISNPTNGNPGPGRQYSFKLQDSHLLLTKICIQYLLFKDFEDHPLEGDDMLDEYVKKNGFLDYSAKHWTAHFHESRTILDQTAPGFRANRSETESVLKLCDASSKRCPTWFRVYWTTVTDRFPGKFTTMMIVSYFGLTAAIIHLLETDTDQDINLDSKDDTYQRSALSWAAGNGFDYVVELLLGGIGGRWRNISVPFRTGAAVDSQDLYGRTPLVYAIWNRHAAVVNILLKGRAGIAAEDSVKGTPLVYAFCCGNRDIEELVSKRGAKVDLHSDRNGLTAMLFSATSKGQEPVLEFLLKTDKVDPDSRDESERTPLSYAAEWGREGIVEKLLETGKVNPNLRDKSGTTPLLYAAARGQEGTVKILLERGKVDPDLGDGKGRTPLSYIAEWGREGIVERLLETGKVNPNLRDKSGTTPLLYAAARGQEGTVKILLERGKVDPDLGDGKGRTPLSYIAGWGQEGNVKLLIETDKVNLDERDIKGRTPLSYAAESGSAPTVKLLLETGKVDPDSRAYEEFESKGCTPLLFAARKGHEAVVRLLYPQTDRVKLEHHNEHYNKGKALLAAMEYGQEMIVQILIEEAKVDPLFSDEFGHGPLLRAIKADSENMVQLILNTGKIDIDQKLHERSTPISLAIKYGSMNAVRALLKAGADPNITINPIPLLQAALEGNPEMVRLLLENGALPDSKDYRGRDATRYMHLSDAKGTPENIRLIRELLDSYSQRVQRKSGR
ncbi:hypothetical protein AOL_s00083g334 [Orbilia oligospora ATCC 24927]|uniref:Uncharacterized protein n=1 Tax=Arthrobotrys oligospora (strain ATCC 24927 / CBS 115.81 / DSM 1491) TaxID=756982 RepID=G1XH53_ARTOA|nr:hypothetical protein AOL_s00083g334 [Orbilia oligospora ATCC 24927]EGX47525.1 hypothetical protein AOL_s00083g334 [Orbilia oligospora ATCC 24927]